jgi:hypothetical protein
VERARLCLRALAGRGVCSSVFVLAPGLFSDKHLVPQRSGLEFKENGGEGGVRRGTYLFFSSGVS